MNTVPVKNIGKIHEQITMEYKSRRNYPRKWSKFYNETPWNEMYNQNEINKQLKTDLKELCPFVYTGEGDSYFLSPEMYNSLVARCRCGRPRNELHLVKCLQNREPKHANKMEKQDVEICEIAAEQKDLSKLPQTSNGFVGWQTKPAPHYKQWENSMKYISPIYDMPGEKVTAKPYNVIIIG